MATTFQRSNSLFLFLNLYCNHTAVCDSGRTVRNTFARHRETDNKSINPFGEDEQKAKLLEEYKLSGFFLLFE
ncbi:MAG: hypothetical protein EAZ08_09785 [Cytophagales bacterium]|nr:MAG: hypothetical protein EAZ08_09785 [Cytophagales bacterium]